MTRILLSIILLALASCQECYAGYTIVIDQQRPQYSMVNGPAGPQMWEASAEAPPMPTLGAEICRPDNYSIFSVDPARRTRVFAAQNGTATSLELFAACPQIRSTREQTIRNEGARRLVALATPYSAAERETWATQRSQAEEWQLDPQCGCAMIRQMASNRGIALESLVAKIMENVTLFEAASGAILGKQQWLLDLIQKEQDFEALLTIQWRDQ